MTRRFIAALLLCAVLFLPSCGAVEADSGSTAPEEITPPPVSQPQEEPAAPEAVPPVPEEAAPDPLELLLESMSVEEKVGQLFFVRCPAEAAVEDIGTYHLGGYVLFGRDTKEKTADALTETIASYQAAASIPLLIGVDEEGGSVVRVSSNSNLVPAGKFKSPQYLWNHPIENGDIFSEDACEKSAVLQRFGINVNLAPVADVSTNPNDFIYSRTLGQDAHTTADYIASTVTAMRECGMGSVLKHFPGYGNNVDTHTGIAVDTRPMETFASSDFLPFLAGISAGGDTTAVLVSHNIITCMDPDLPASLSPAVHTILRETLGFDGVSMTDDLAMDAVESYAADGSAAVMALCAGNDLIITSDYRTQIPQVLAAIESGELEKNTIDTACRRVLKWKQALGLIT